MVKLERNNQLSNEKSEIYRKLFEFCKVYMIDHCLDNGDIDIDEYITKHFMESKYRFDAYGGNGCYDIYALCCNKLRDLLIKFK